MLSDLEALTLVVADKPDESTPRACLQDELMACGRWDLAAIAELVCMRPRFVGMRRLAADFFESQGQVERAEFTRIGCELEGKTPVWDAPPDVVSERDRFVGSSIRLAVLSSRMPELLASSAHATPKSFIRLVDDGDMARPVYNVADAVSWGGVPSYTAIHCGEPQPILNPIDVGTHSLLTTRARRLWATHYPTWLGNKGYLGEIDPRLVGHRLHHWWCGFIDRIDVSSEFFRERARDLLWHVTQNRPCPLTAQPIEHVALTTTTAIPDGDGWLWRSRYPWVNMSLPSAFNEHLGGILVPPPEDKSDLDERRKVLHESLAALVRQPQGLYPQLVVESNFTVDVFDLPERDYGESYLVPHQHGRKHGDAWSSTAIMDPVAFRRRRIHVPSHPEVRHVYVGVCDECRTCQVEIPAREKE